MIWDGTGVGSQGIVCTSLHDVIRVAPELGALEDVN